MAYDYEKSIRPGKLPHIWCPGCGHGIVMKGLIRAMDACGLEKNNTAIVSGIGCASRLPGYMDFCTLHTAHGRAAAFATGVKMAKPEMTVICCGGDGDGTAIGGNHFIHACRRNIDMTYVLMNNYIYGMTGGQFSPCTPTGDKASTTPYGNPETPFNLPLLAYASGATYVARWTMIHVRDLIHAFIEAINHRGFAFIEVLSPCPINYGRRNKESAMQILHSFQDKTIIQNGADPAALGMDFSEGVTLGKFVHVDKPTQDECYAKVCLGEE